MSCEKCIYWSPIKAVGYGECQAPLPTWVNEQDCGDMFTNKNFGKNCPMFHEEQNPMLMSYNPYEY